VILTTVKELQEFEEKCKREVDGRLTGEDEAQVNVRWTGD
jgi:hypothetical protein